MNVCLEISYTVEGSENVKCKVRLDATETRSLSSSKWNRLAYECVIELGRRTSEVALPADSVGPLLVG